MSPSNVPQMLLDDLVSEVSAYVILPALPPLPTSSFSLRWAN